MLASKATLHAFKIVEHWTLWRIKAFISIFYTGKANGAGDVFAVSFWWNEAALIHSSDYPPPTPPEYKRGGSQYHTAERRLQFFNISLAS